MKGCRRKKKKANQHMHKCKMYSCEEKELETLMQD